MRFFLVDDDEVIRSILRHIIEDEDLGEVTGEADDGSLIDEKILMYKQVDILIIDLLMPERDGIETVRQLKGSFSGKIIMLSQVETKELIGEAYSLGIEYYIMKPINRYEVLSVIKKITERIRMERSIQDIQKSLNLVLSGNNNEVSPPIVKENTIFSSGEFLLSELGIVGESGSKDLLEILQYLFRNEKHNTYEHHFPPLKDIFEQIAIKKLGDSAFSDDMKKEIKASEQRVRRAIYQSLVHLASIGLTDFSNPKFENYALKYFDFTNVRKKMTELQKGTDVHHSHIRINTKKFIQVLYFEAKRLILEEN
ncbi:response regulator [Bacillus sp. 03113]|uniref:response regulator n=1 Tax=Bacillus sp. 03113 TaxID=2578211 RepID=UPI0011437989|nr:response regulator [Bacillus sp. 03113]